jgi:F0F1-type ATP synthase assembly protein I
MKDPKKKDDEQKKANFLAINLGTELVGPIILGGLAGYWIDKSNHTSNKWTLILLVLGIVIGIYNFIKIVRRLSK